MSLQLLSSLTQLTNTPAKLTTQKGAQRGAVGISHKIGDTINAFIADLQQVNRLLDPEVGPSTFGIFDAFADDAGRDAHLSGPIAAALVANAAELPAEPPTIEKVQVLAAKLDAPSLHQNSFHQ